MMEERRWCKSNCVRRSSASLGHKKVFECRLKTRLCQSQNSDINVDFRLSPDGQTTRLEMTSARRLLITFQSKLLNEV